MADLLGLGGPLAGRQGASGAAAAGDVAEKVQNLIAAVEHLLDKLEFPRSIAELGIAEDEYERAIPDLAAAAFDDPSWRSNPRMPLVTELVDLFRLAYRGRGQRAEPEKEYAQAR
jgi:acetaldehyde dehydrogenase/alcohol dehydrogenase